MTEIKNWRVGLVGLAASVLAVYFISTQIDLADLGHAFQTARYEYVMLCAGLLAAGLVTRAVRWQLLLNGGLPFWRAFHIMNISYLVNGVIPLRIGELARVFLAARAEPPVPAFQSASTIIVERLLDLLAVIGLIALVVIAGPLPDEIRTAALALAPLALVGFLMLVGLAMQRQRALRLAERLVRRMPRFERLDITGRLSNFLNGLEPLTRPAALFNAILWTAISWGLSVTAGYILMFAFYPQASWVTTYLFIAAAALAIAVPAVPGNVGTYELSIMFALGATGYGEPESTALAFAVVVHGVNLMVYALLGLVGFVGEGISLVQLSQGVEKMQQSKAGS